MKTTLGAGGRLVIPAEIRKEMGLKPGDAVVLTVQDRELRVVSMNEAIKRAQELVRKYVPEGVSLVDELIRERREEASRE